MKNALFSLVVRLRRRIGRLSLPRVPLPLPERNREGEVCRAAELIDPGDIRGKRVLDIHCGTGGLSFLALSWKARDVTGVDPRTAQVEEAAGRAERYGTAPFPLFVRDDPDRYAFWSGLPAFDTLLCRLPSSPGAALLLARASSCAREVMYVWGPPGAAREEVIETILSAVAFPHVEFRGETGGGEKKRAVFRLARTVLTQKEAARLIASWMKEGRYARIAVAGKRGTGKSRVKKYLERLIDFDHDYAVVDDCHDRAYLAGLSRLVLFDYRALEYLPDFEAVFLVHTDEMLRRNDAWRSRLGRFVVTKWLGYRILPSSHLLTPSPGGSFTAARVIHAVKR